MITFSAYKYTISPIMSQSHSYLLHTQKKPTQITTFNALSLPSCNWDTEKYFYWD